jgi:hypothetical protein
MLRKIRIIKFILKNLRFCKFLETKKSPSKSLLKGCFVSSPGIKKFEILLTQRFYPKCNSFRSFKFMLSLSVAAGLGEKKKDKIIPDQLLILIDPEQPSPS